MDKQRYKVKVTLIERVSEEVIYVDATGEAEASKLAEEKAKGWYPYYFSKFMNGKYSLNIEVLETIKVKR